ncbi:MAG: ATP-binding protein [Gammaproteobacteria bacterium]|nr:ATP-binding protein [Gammaproteobacteria bacterium]
MTTTLLNAEHEKTIHSIKVGMLYKQGLAGYLVALIDALLLVFVIWGQVDTLWVSLWLVYILLVSGMRIVFWLMHFYRPNSCSVDRWLKRATWGAFLMGLAWSIAGILLFVLDSPLHMVFVAFVLVGMAVGGMPLMSPVPKVFYVFSLPIIVPLGAMFFFQGNQVGISLGVMTWLLVLIIVSGTEHLHKALDSSLRLQFQNDELVEGLRRSRDEALAANRAKTQFLANMSHEVRTPMNGVLGTLQLLDASPLENQQRAYVTLAQNSAESLLKLLDDILDLSRLEVDKVELEQLSFDLKEVCEGVAGVMVPLAMKKGLVLNYELDEKLPRRVLGDSSRLSQVLSNLLSNAIKFTSEGAVSLSVSLQATHGRELILLFEVTDQGIGIEASAQDVLFQRFTQVDSSTTRVYGGTGLGLAICKELVNLMRGEIGVSSQVGVGSRFWFSVPLSIDPQVELLPSPVSTDENSSLQGEVLLVEDVVINQMTTRKILQSKGLTVTVVNNGREALEAFTDKIYDLVLMDCLMPEMDGYEATEKMRLQEQNGEREAVPIVALTANVMPQDIERCFSSGMNDYLAKPFKRNQLTEKVRFWLEPSTLS